MADQRGPYHMEGRVNTLMDRLEAMETDLRRMDDKWQKSVDDIKATIRSEVSELKTEQIADLKIQIKETKNENALLGLKVSELAREQDRWQAGGSVVGWLIKTVIAIGGALAGAFGWEHIRH